MDASRSHLSRLASFGLLCLALVSGCARHGAVSKAALAPPLPAPLVAPSGGGQLFADPKAAVDALLAACATGNENAVVSVFGEPARKLVSTGNATRDRERCSHFTNSAKQMTRIDPDAPGRVHVVVGHDDWKLPIPLVQTTGGWQFDSGAGAKEVAARRVGSNELETIRVLRAFVAAQREYERTHGAYARRFASRPGRQDGLAWPTRRGRPASPFAPALGRALQEGRWAGYRYRILTGQGANAPGGAKSYLDRGRMTGGFAAVAWPETYGTTGVMTFLVDAAGTVVERDLGSNTATLAGDIAAFDTAGGWKRLR